ncbi:MAG: sugar phosphate nucleotidyltransferase [bacterium]
MNIVIMAGGGGTRLWPLSRQSKPKQFLDLGTGRTLLEDTFNRARTITPENNIYVATVRDYQRKIKQLLPEVLADHIFCEPEKRDTTAAFASITLRLEHLRQGSEPTIFMWSDHVFTNEDVFINDLKKIPGLIKANPDSLIIVGHVPVTPETTLGYIEAGDKVDDYSNVYRINCFKEKPDKATAEKFVVAGNYFWNLGYFSTRPSYLLSELKAQSPDLAPAIEQFAQALAAGNETKIIAAYSAFPKISIEYTLIEKTSRIIAIIGDYGWSDVGNWEIVERVFGQKGDYMPRGHHIHIDSRQNYIYNTTGKAVSLIGVKNTIVVVTDDAILITNKGKSHKVKEVVEQLKKDKKSDVL